MALQLYRQSAVGDTLNDALHEMVSEEKISGALADRVMLEVIASPLCSFGLIVKAVQPCIPSISCLQCHTSRNSHLRFACLYH